MASRQAIGSVVEPSCCFECEGHEHVPQRYVSQRLVTRESVAVGETENGEDVGSL